MNVIMAQVIAFLLTLILGILAGVVFHFYQLVIRKGHVGRISLYIFDIIFWMLMIIVIFLGLLFINQGEIRIYVFLALIAGIFLYFKLLSSYCIYLLTGMAGLTVKGGRILYDAAVWPLHLMTKWIKTMIKKPSPIPPPHNPE